jgi:toxin ParE1/3/4
MQVIWSSSAVAQLAEIRAFIELDKPEAALVVARRIVVAADRLAINPSMGRPGRVPETRELVIAGTPYILHYKINGERLKILAIFHAARDRPGDR